MADQELGFSIKITGTDEQLDQLGKVEASLKKLSQERSRLNKAVKEGEITEEQYGREIADVNLKTKNLRDTKRNLSKSIETENNLVREQTGSYNELSQRLNKLRNDYKNLSKADREGEIGKEMLQNIDELDTELKDLDAGMGQYQRNVGNYSSALDGLDNVFGGSLGNVNQYSEVFNSLIINVGGYREAMDGAIAKTQGQTAATKAGRLAIQGKVVALKLLRNALIATGIGAFVVILGSLIAAFASTQRGADAFRRVIEPLKALFQTFVGFLQNVAIATLDRLKAAFNDPKQAIQDFGKAIVDNVLNRFRAFSKFAPAIVKILKGDLSEGFNDLANAGLQAATGVEDAADKLRKFTEDSAQAGKDALEVGKQIAALDKEINLLEIDLTKNRSRLRREFAEYKNIAEDTKKTEEERAAAAQKAIDAEQKRRALELALLDKKIAKMRLEQSLNDTSDEEKLELAELEAEKENIIAESTERVIEVRNKRNTIEEQLDAQARERLKKARSEELQIIERNNERILELATQRVDQEIALMEEGTGRSIAEAQLEAKRKIEALEKQRVKEEGLQGERLAEAQQINQLIADNTELVQKRLQKRLLEIEQQGTAQRLKEAEELTKLKTQNTKRQAELAELIVKRRVRQGAITEQQGAKEIIAIRQRSLQKQLEATQAQQEKIKSTEQQLQNELVEISKQAQTEENAARRKAIEEQLAEVDTQNEEVAILYQQLLARLDEINTVRKEEKGGVSFMGGLFQVSEEEAQAIESQLAQQLNATLGSLFALRRQMIQNNLDAEVKQYEKRNDSLISQEERRMDREKRLLEQRLEVGQISQEEYNERIQTLEERTANRKEQIENETQESIENARKEAFEREKELRKVQTLLNAAAAAIKIWTDTPTPAVPFALALLAAQTAMQMATIQTQQFERGGIAEGPLHKDGGISARVGGAGMIELEGGEAIINRRSSAMFPELLSAINNFNGFGDAFAGQSNPQFLQAGGVVTAPTRPRGTTHLSRADMDYLSNRITEGVVRGVVQGVVRGVVQGVNDKRVILTQQDRQEFDTEVELTQNAEQW